MPKNLNDLRAEKVLRAEIAALRADALELDRDGMDPRLVREMNERADREEAALEEMVG